jgi:hypothetical protein
LTGLANIAFLGCKPGEKGFIVGSKMGNIPEEEARNHFNLFPEQARSLRPYMGGEELNNNPLCEPSRSILHVDDRDTSCLKETLTFLSGYISKKRLEKPTWYRYSAPAKELMVAMRNLNRCYLLAETSSSFVFGVGDAKSIYSNTVWCFIDTTPGLFAFLQSALHEEWTRLLSSTLKDDLRYVASACLETIPISRSDFGDDLIDIEVEFLKTRDAIIKNHHDKTLRGFKTRFNSPYCNDDGIIKVRGLWAKANARLLASIGYQKDVTYGFGLDYLDLSDEVEASPEILALIEEGVLHFSSAELAIDFENQLKGLGDDCKLSWRYRWPDDVRDEVLARLLALNADRFEEEVNLGLHSKSTKQATKITSRRKTKSGSSAGLQLTSEPYQTGLKLF